jgi:hypothetical protein
MLQYRSPRLDPTAKKTRYLRSPEDLALVDFAAAATKESPLVVERNGAEATAVPNVDAANDTDAIVSLQERTTEDTCGRADVVQIPIIIKVQVRKRICRSIFFGLLCREQIRIDCAPAMRQSTKGGKGSIRVNRKHSLRMQF